MGDPPPPDPGPVNGQAPVPIPVPSPVPNVPATFDVSVTTLEHPIAIRFKAS
ncbi:MAG: hypothetical protein H7318_06395 [Oligoflexus sp.]|nr:hypothetical protein [Oligoflexus sp.]